MILVHLELGEIEQAKFATSCLTPDEVIDVVPTHSELILNENKKFTDFARVSKLSIFYYYYIPCYSSAPPPPPHSNVEGGRMRIPFFSGKGVPLGWLSRGKLVKGVFLYQSPGDMGYFSEASRKYKNI